MKGVITIRVGKNEDDLKDYLDQFGEKEQNKAAKELLLFGLRHLKDLKQVDQNEKILEAINGLRSDLKKWTVVKQPSDPEDSIQDDKEIVDPEAIKNNIQESLALFNI